jgi:preflagellin peptidase FlaK
MVSELPFFDIIRFITGFSILAYASYTDIKIRKAANFLWLIMGGVGGSLLIIQYLFFNGFGNQTLYLLFIPIIIFIMYVFFQLRLLFGGADAKAMMAIAILVPLTPSIYSFPLFPSILPCSWVIFSNAVVLFLALPLSLLVYNLMKRHTGFPYLLLGYKMDLDKARKKFVWPLERVVDGKIKFSSMPTSIDPTEQFDALEKLGKKMIWVTPKIPFMIPLLAGFICAFFIGDLLFMFTQLFT